jgi:PEP-CTERM motif-containing protein
MRARLFIIAGSLLMLSSMASAATRIAIAVPEPSTLAMAGMGAVGLAGAIWRKIRQ